MNSKVYGIDLGTTNSLIGYDGVLFGKMIPSIADIKSKSAGEHLRENFNSDISRSFKVNMSLGKEGRESVLASSLVLKRLVEEVSEPVERVVISVPAYFSDNERQATISSAKAIGLTVEAIINEPTAAAIYRCRDRKSLTVVYDLGGGTFDVSIIDSRLDNYDVQATDGLKIGGDNLDSNLVKLILKKCRMAPHRMNKEDLPKLKYLCEKAKIEIQKYRKSATIDLSEFSHCTKEHTAVITEEEYIEITKLTFEDTIRITKQLLYANIFEGTIYEILMVGGSTRCPYLKEWLEEELNHNILPQDYDPDLIVALGASIFAKLVETGEAELQVSDVTKAFGIAMSDGSVKNIIPKNSKLPYSDYTLVSNSIESDKLTLNVYQGDSVSISSNNFIGTLVYNYNRVVAPHQGVVKVTISIDTNGVITLKASEPLKEEVSIVLQREEV